MLAELIDAVVGVDTHRDTHEVELALPTGTPIGIRKISNDNSGFAELLAWIVDHAPAGLAFGCAAGDVVLGGGAASDAGDGDGVDCAVQCPVAAAVEPMPNRLAATGLQWTGA
jgi:hypothetical protein